MQQMRHRFTNASRRLSGIALAGSAAVVGLSGCGPFGPATSPVASLHGGTHSPASSTANDLQKYQAVVVCARLHGLPDAPDAHLDDHGQPQFPTLPGGGKPPQSVLDGCKDQIAQLPQRTDSTRSPLSAAALAKVRQFAACVRSNGYPNFPDPGPDGGFSAPADGSHQLPPKDSPAFQGCRHLLPSLGR